MRPQDGAHARACALEYGAATLSTGDPRLSTNSFDAKATLTVGERSYEIFRLDALQAEVRHRASAVLAEDPAREPAAQRGRRVDPRAGHRGARDLEREGASRAGDRVHAGARADAGLHRRARGRRPRRDARRDARDGRRPGKINPLVPAELVIDHSVQVDVFGTPQRVPAQRRARVRAQPGALRVPALGPGRVRELRGRPAGHRDRAPGQPRVPGARRVRRRRTTNQRLSRHARRHRLAHDDGQRPRRARLGRRRHRGRGGDARPADVDADPAGARLQADRRAARGRDRDRPRADRHRDAAQTRRRRQVRRVLRRRPRRLAARRPRDDRQHVAGVRLDLRDLPDRRRDAPLPRVLRATQGADRAGRGVREGAGAVARRGLRGADVHRRGSSSTSRRSCRASPDRSAPRTACR